MWYAVEQAWTSIGWPQCQLTEFAARVLSLNILVERLGHARSWGIVFCTYFFVKVLAQDPSTIAKDVLLCRYLDITSSPISRPSPLPHHTASAPLDETLGPRGDGLMRCCAHHHPRRKMCGSEWTASPKLWRSQAEKSTASDDTFAVIALPYECFSVVAIGCSYPLCLIHSHPKHGKKRFQL